MHVPIISITSLLYVHFMSTLCPLYVHFAACSSLYWTSFEVDGSVALLTAGLNGSDPHSVFDPPNLTKPSRGRHRRETCSCPPHLTITEVFTLDHSRKGVLELYVVDRLTGSVVAMDTDGCHCKRVVDTHSLHNTSEYSWIVVAIETNTCNHGNMSMSHFREQTSAQVIVVVMKIKLSFLGDQ